MNTKKIKLKNNIVALLNTSELDDVYRINASIDGVFAGECNFNIVLIYALDTTGLDENNLPSLAKKFKKEGLKVSPHRLGGYKQEDGKIKLGGLYFTYQDTIIELNKIHVRDEKYGNIGLGHAMLIECEKVAKQHKASRIEANYYPFGALKFSTYDFYKRNGFTWDKSHITKELKHNNPNHIK